MAIVADVRRTIGDGVRLMLDFNQAQSTASAVERIRRLQEFDLTWVEEPVAAEDLVGHRAVRERVRPTPIQTGENWWFPQGMANAIAAGASDLAMVDIMKIGGITGWMSAMAQAEAAALPLSNHTFVEASAHVMAVSPTASWFEYLDIAGAVLKDPLLPSTVWSTRVGRGSDWTGTRPQWLATRYSDGRHACAGHTDLQNTSNQRKASTMSTTAAVEPQTSITVWNLDPAHSIAEFKVRHMMIANVKGRFSKLSGVLTLEESDLANSSVESSIETSSIDTRDAERDAHLKSADFFDVTNFPTLKFKSARISIVGDGQLSVEGDLTIHGVTRKVRFAVKGPTPPTKDPWGNMRVAISGVAKINRSDFGLTWNAALETGGILVGDEVTITLDVEFVKA